jgi:hypothetical protein
VPEGVVLETTTCPPPVKPAVTCLNSGGPDEAALPCEPVKPVDPATVEADPVKPVLPVPELPVNPIDPVKP